MKKYAMALVSMLIACSSAQAAITGVWSTKEGCDWITKFNKDPSAVSPDNLFDFMYLSKEGIEGYEWGCRFLRSYDGEYGETVNIASCSAEGDLWPQMMITSYDGTQGWGVSILNNKMEPERVMFPARCDR
jgi:hypothetical protein